MGTKSKGSLGVLSGLSLQDEEVKNVDSKEVKNSGIKEGKSKRSYSLPDSTILKLGELKLYDYPPNVTLEDIVNEAIINWYDLKHKK
jgi:hypothetical protein